MDLVQEQDLAVLEGGEEGGQVARPLDDRAGGRFDGRLQLGGDDVGQAGLAHPRGPEEENVVQGLSSALRGLDGDPQVLHHLDLANVLV